MSGPAHVPVMLAEVVELVRPAPGRLLIDATFGAGGYSRAFLAAGATVLAFDRDPAARAFAEPLAADRRFRIVTASFSTMAEVVGEGAADAVAMDLGVSSMQLDEAERGFSFMRDGPLDMRMSGLGQSAADLVNQAEPAELARLFRLWGEERQARRIAQALAHRRSERPFERTVDLAEAVERAVGGRRGARIHPATRVFQALRIAVNAEIAELAAGLGAAEAGLKQGGVLAVVSFHSLEDRLVKSFLSERAGRSRTTSRHAPPAPGGPAPSFRLLFSGARSPGPAEAAANPRARSARLRAAERTGAPAMRLAA
ncbi:MAG: 16S rRNA (cytosine(1402)-N(4))-methyltransferase RsmH [Caulobacteraceae bacterium]